MENSSSVKDKAEVHSICIHSSCRLWSHLTARVARTYSLVVCQEGIGFDDKPVIFAMVTKMGLKPRDCDPKQLTSILSAFLFFFQKATWDL